MQLHLQVDPHEFGLYWNAAQAMSAPLLAAANSPFFGKQLHHETRIALFEQAADTRTEELILQGVRPRVWFGEKWLDEGEWASCSTRTSATRRCCRSATTTRIRARC